MIFSASKFVILQVAEMVLVWETIQMELEVVLGTGEEGDLDPSMDGGPKVVTYMAELIFRVSWEVERQVLMSLLGMLQEGE